MKKLLLILALLSALLYSCTKENIQTYNGIVKKDTLKTSISDLKFKISPTATDQFTFSVLNQNSNTYKLYLRKGNTEVASYLLVTEKNNNSISSAAVKYNFSPNDVYQISIQATRENTDTVFQEEFIINEYTHQYFNKFSYEKLASINQRLDFDISPSRNMIFYLDYIDNKPVLKRLSLTDKKLNILDDNFFSLLIRSKSDNQLIVSTGKYNNRFLKGDSCALLSYDVNTHESSFVDWGSSDYGRYSRVVNNSIMVSNPVYTNSVSLVNLADNSKKTYPADIRFLSEYNFNQIAMGGEILNFSNFNFENRLPSISSNSSIAYFDDNSQYYITEEYYRESQSSSYFTRMVIYKDNKVVYEQPYEKGRWFSLPSIINLKDNKLIFQQGYEYDSTIKLDGYYLLDIGTKKITFLQNDNNNYAKYDFFSDGNKNSFISVRPYEIYKITMN
jgi:hypothetical protein